MKCFLFVYSLFDFPIEMFFPLKTWSSNGVPELQNDGNTRRLVRPAKLTIVEF